MRFELLKHLLRIRKTQFHYAPKLLSIEDASALLEEQKQAICPKAVELYGKVRQNLGFLPLTPEELRLYGKASRLLEQYLHLYEQLRLPLGFCEARPTIAFNHYDKGGFIEPHYDESQFRNIIAIYTLSGSSPFAVYDQNRQKIAEFLFQPGDAFFIAAPISKEDKKIRPLHSVGPTLETRRAIVIRHEVGNGQNYH